MREVPKEEFDAFIDSLVEAGIKLRADIVRIVEPPMLQYNDHSNGKVWPESVVASVSLTENYEKDGPEPYRWSPNTYYL